MNKKQSNPILNSAPSDSLQLHAVCVDTVHIFIAKTAKIAHTKHVSFLCVAQIDLPRAQPAVLDCHWEVAGAQRFYLCSFAALVEASTPGAKCFAALWPCRPQPPLHKEVVWAQAGAIPPQDYLPGLLYHAELLQHFVQWGPWSKVWPGSPTDPNTKNMPPKYPLKKKIRVGGWMTHWVQKFFPLFRNLRDTRPDWWKNEFPESTGCGNAVLPGGHRCDEKQHDAHERKMREDGRQASSAHEDSQNHVG